MAVLGATHTHMAAPLRLLRSLLLISCLLHLLHLLLLCLLLLLLQFMMVGFSRSDDTDADNTTLAGDLPSLGMMASWRATAVACH